VTMSAESHSRGEPITAINVTPLVDVMLVLLVIFMVTARLDDAHALPLDLPRAASGAATQRVLEVAIDAEGGLFVDRAPIANDAAFLGAVRAARARDPDVRTVIAAPKLARHGQVMHVLDLLRLSGIAKVAFAVEPAP
jgi:biopolymer transport protein ExbD